LDNATQRRRSAAVEATSRASVPIRNRSEVIARTRCTRQASRGPMRVRGQVPATLGQRRLTTTLNLALETRGDSRPPDQSFIARALSNLGPTPITC
jgi:hypothetical protein